ncbi:MAG TPA: hypothetical protein VLH60_07355, partial [Sedimentisphaerales bacterium]|nr:hypothetical protein [Sedimentisphaerales bacterium]
MNTRHIAALIVIAASPTILSAQEAEGDSNFARASESIHRKLETSLAELSRLREQVAAETVPLSRKLSELESELVNVRLEHQNAVRLLDRHTLDLSNLGNEIRSRQQEAAFLSNLLGEYTRNFESRLHIAELQRYRHPLEAARLAADNRSLSEQEIHETQADLLGVSLDRLFDALGGASFGGTATDSTGSIHHGTFVVIGPAAIFQSDDGMTVGAAEQRLGSLEPTVIPFRNPADAEAAAKVVAGLNGYFPLDPTGGNAHKIEQTEDTLLEHIKKGGPVMYPIFALAGTAFLVVVFKWVCLMLVRKPSRKQISAVLAAIA